PCLLALERSHAPSALHPMKPLGSSSSEEEEEEARDWPLLAAEVALLLLAILALLLLLSGFGLWTVRPPGEAELCRVETLGLQNSTQSQRTADLAACRGLYSVVFRALGAISLPFLVCGCIAFFISTLLLQMLGRPRPGNVRRHFCCIGFVEVLGLAIAVTGGESGDGAMNKAAHLYEVLYQGYCAVSRVELCLTIGSISLVLLFWVFVADLARNVVSSTCWQPRCEGRGSQLLQLLKRS
ncbi:unnamed protein product, partial [Effrenium voratum]